MSSLRACVFSKGSENEMSACAKVFVRFKLEGMTETASAGGEGGSQGRLR